MKVDWWIDRNLLLQHRMDQMYTSCWGLKVFAWLTSLSLKAQPKWTKLSTFFKPKMNRWNEACLDGEMDEQNEGSVGPLPPKTTPAHQSPLTPRWLRDVWSSLCWCAIFYFNNSCCRHTQKTTNIVLWRCDF